MFKEYIKYTHKSGGVSQLADLYDKPRQHELKEDGFVMARNKDGKPIIITSGTLLGTPGKHGLDREQILEDLMNEDRN